MRSRMIIQMTARRVREARCRPLLVGGLALTALLIPMSGCQDVLFPPNTPRTQFEAYDRMRNEAAPEKEYDALGKEKPALRARLAPR